MVALVTALDVVKAVVWVAQDHALVDVKANALVDANTNAETDVTILVMVLVKVLVIIHVHGVAVLMQTLGNK